MLSETLIAALVLLLGGYWFRYNCLSILRGAISPERAHQAAAANDLTFPGVRKLLEEDLTPADLASLNEGLLRDFRVLACLLRYTATTTYSVDQRILIADFHCMQICFAVTRRHFRRQARRALGECINILSHFASTLGNRSATVLRS